VVNWHGYYRFGPATGTGLIAVSLVFIVIVDFLWESESGNPLSSWLPFDTILPLYASIAESIVLIAIILWFIRLLTRRAIIKM
jgi:hypothetical protein